MYYNVFFVCSNLTVLVLGGKVLVTEGGLCEQCPEAARVRESQLSCSKKDPIWVRDGVGSFKARL